MTTYVADVIPAPEHKLPRMAHGDSFGFAKSLCDRFTIYGAKAFPPIRLFVH